MGAFGHTDRMQHKLKSYLKTRGLSYAAFGESIGMSAASVSDIINWHQTPSLLAAWNIEQATKGKVKMQDCVNHDQ